MNGRRSSRPAAVRFADLDLPGRPPRGELVRRRRRAGQDAPVRPEAVEEQRAGSGWRSSRVRAPSPSRIDDTCSRISDRSSTTDVGPQAAVGLRPVDDRGRSARPRAWTSRYSSSFGANVPARFIVIATVCASRSRAMKSAKAVHASRSSATAASASSRYCWQPVARHLAEQVLLARVAPVERADAHARARRDGRHRRVRIGGEHLPRGLRGSAGRCAAPGLAGRSAGAPADSIWTR